MSVKPRRFCGNAERRHDNLPLSAISPARIAAGGNNASKDCNRHAGNQTRRTQGGFVPCTVSARRRTANRPQRSSQEPFLWMNPGQVFWLPDRPTDCTFPRTDQPIRSGLMQRSSPVTAAGPRRTCTVFPILPPNSEFGGHPDSARDHSGRRNECKRMTGLTTCASPLPRRAGRRQPSDRTVMHRRRVGTEPRPAGSGPEVAGETTIEAASCRARLLANRTVVVQPEAHGRPHRRANAAPLAVCDGAAKREHRARSELSESPGGVSGRLCAGRAECLCGSFSPSSANQSLRENQKAGRPALAKALVRLRAFKDRPGCRQWW